MSIDTITFNIPSELKEEFQIKVIKDKTTMTDKLLEFIKEYIEK